MLVKNMPKKINETVVVSIPLKDYSKHKLAKHIPFILKRSYRSSYDLYYYEPLKKIFSNVIVYDYMRRMIEVGVDVNKEIIDIVRKEHPKYFIHVFSRHEFTESTLNAIRNEGTVVVGIFFDDEFLFDMYTKYWIPYVDYCITNDIKAIPKYKKLGARVVHTLPCNGVPVEKDWNNANEKYDVSFVGVRRNRREQYINELRKRGISVHTFGRGWDSGFISFKEMIDIFSSSKISLNFAETYDDKLNIRTGWKGRVLEVCMAGGFLLTDYIPGMEDFFEIGKEVVCFSDLNDMIQKAEYYLSHEKERLTIAKAGWKRAVNNHTPYHMLNRAFNKIEKDLKINGRQEKNIVGPEMKMRKDFSNFYFLWSWALSMENYKTWKDLLHLSIKYNPFNLIAWLYYFVGLFPYVLRRTIIRYIFNAIMTIRRKLTLFIYNIFHPYNLDLEM